MLTEKTEETSAEESEAVPAKPRATKRAPAKRKKANEQAGAERHNQEVGDRGEAAAVQYLIRKGFEIRDRNWKCQAGEADIIAEDEDALVFVEVKTRANCEHGFPEEAVDEKKRKRYEKIASYYLKDYEADDKAVRFDVISILVIAPERAFLRHYKNAFSTWE